MPDVAPLIRPLAGHLVNQIAAGEVIERPASVVKELVENSLDAGARAIDIEVLDGGIESITVSDDGCGIRGEELPAALRRHGRASSTSRATRHDRHPGLPRARPWRVSARWPTWKSAAAPATTHAWQIAVRAGTQPGSPTPASGNPGSRIVVRRLFHQLPARRRFLKQPRTEFLHIQRLVRQLAFARPDVSFSLAQGAARGLRVRPADYAELAPRWQSVFGTAFCRQACQVAAVIDGITIRGWVGAMGAVGPPGDIQYFALNGRVIRDRQLQHAVRSAYGDALAPGQLPVYALALDIDPGAVDVNVHPGKLKVRFAALRAVHDVVHAAVRQALAAAAARMTARTQDGVGERRSAWPVAHAAAPRPPPGDVVAASPAPRGDLAAPWPWSGRTHFARAARRGGVAVRFAGLRRARARRTPGRWCAATAPLLLPVRPARKAGRALAARADLAALGFAFDDFGPAG